MKQKIFQLLSSNLFLIAILCIIGMLIYSNTFNSPFVFDGIKYIEENVSIRSIGNVKAIWNFWPSRFIAFLSFAINYHFHKLNPPGYHLINLIIHMGSAIFVFLVVLLTFSTPYMSDKMIAKDTKLIAFFSALIFVSHPVQTQAVTYIYQRSTCLATLLYLASLYLYIRARLTGMPRYYLGSLITMLVGMFTKEIVFSLPFVIILYEICFLSRKGDKKPFIRSIPFFIGAGIIPLVILLTKFVHIKGAGLIADQNIAIIPLHYLLTQLKVLITYLRLLCIPINLNLDYDYPIAKSITEPSVLISLLLLIALIVLAVRLFSRHRELTFSIFWFFIVLLPESSIVTLNDLINEHRLYLPMVGFSLFLSTMLYYLLHYKPQLLKIIIIILLIFYGSLTYFRNIIWSDALTLWSDTIDKSPKKARPYVGRGVAYNKKGQYDKAIIDFNKALCIDSKYIDTYYNRGCSYLQKGVYDGAIADFTYVLKINPMDIAAYNNRGITYGQIGDFDKAIVDFTGILKVDAKNVEAYNNRIVAYIKKGDYPKAREEIKKSQELGCQIEPEIVKLLTNTSQRD